jgi:hypothetical protein
VEENFFGVKGKMGLEWIVDLPIPKTIHRMK